MIFSFLISVHVHTHGRTHTHTDTHTHTQKKNKYNLQLYYENKKLPSLYGTIINAQPPPPAPVSLDGHEYFWEISEIWLNFSCPTPRQFSKC